MKERKVIYQTLQIPFRVIDRTRLWIRNKINHYYSRNSIKLRKGRCNTCGLCCPYWCSHLDKSGRCITYKDRPKGCRVFPVDKKSLSAYGVKNECKYYWDKNDTEDINIGKKHIWDILFWVNAAFIIIFFSNILRGSDIVTGTAYSLNYSMVFVFLLSWIPILLITAMRDREYNKKGDMK